MPTKDRRCFLQLATWFVSMLACLGALSTSGVAATLDGLESTRTGVDVQMQPLPHPPVILLHGSGPRRMPQSVVSMQPFAELLVARGFQRRHIHLPVYPQGGDRVQSIGAIRSAMHRIRAQYPEGTTFDIVGHSMGQFVGMMAVLEGDMVPMVRTLVGLAGVAHGQDRRNRGCLLLGGCGDLFTLLRPAHGGWIAATLRRYAAELGRMKKCSIFSPEDGVLDPYDSGAFADGTNVELRNIRHVQFIKNAYVADQMIARCLADGS